MSVFSGKFSIIVAFVFGAALICGTANATTTITLDETATAQKFVRFGDLGVVAGDNATLIKRQFVAPLTEEGAVFTRADLTRRLQILGLEQGVVFKGSERVTVFYDDGADDFFMAPELEWENSDRNNSPFQAVAQRRDSGAPVAGAVQLTGVSADAATPQPRARATRAVAQKTERRQAPKISRQEEISLQAAVDKMLAQEFADFPSRSRVAVRRTTFAGAEFSQLEITGIREGKIPGRAVVDVVLKGDAQKILAYGTAEIFTEVDLQIPVLARTLNQGDIIRASDIALAFQKFTGARPEKFTLQELVGRECQKSLRVGSPISLADFAPPPAVKKGDEVLISVRGAGFLVEERAIAMSGGQVGDVIMVQSNSVDEKGKPYSYRARLTGPHTATLVK